jgi:hypothetical protein
MPPTPNTNPFSFGKPLTLNANAENSELPIKKEDEQQCFNDRGEEVKGHRDKVTEALNNATKKSLSCGRGWPQGKLLVL